MLCVEAMHVCEVICFHVCVCVCVLHVIDIVIAIEMCHFVILYNATTTATTTITIKTFLIDIQCVYKSLKMHFAFVFTLLPLSNFLFMPFVKGYVKMVYFAGQPRKCEYI